MTIRQLIDGLQEIARYSGDHHKVVVSDEFASEGEILHLSKVGEVVMLDVKTLVPDNDHAL